MNVLKNFEAVFVVALGVAASASLLSRAPEQMSAAVPQAQGASVATPSKMAVVTVSAKRMSAVEKQRSLEDERRLVRQGNVAANRI
jgi:hypothetical protein